jgi:hypothetical protein
MNRFITSSAKGNELIMPKLPYTTFSHSLGHKLKELGVDYLHIDSGFGFINPKGSPSDGYPLEGIKVFANATRHLSRKAAVRAVAVNLLPDALTKRILGIGWRYTEAANAHFAREFKKHVGLPVIANGGFQNRSTIEAALESDCDLVAIGRPLLASPDLLDQYRDDPSRDCPKNPCSWCSLCCTKTAVLPVGCYDIRRFGGPNDPTAQDRMEDQILHLSADHSPSRTCRSARPRRPNCTVSLRNLSLPFKGRVRVGMGFNPAAEPTPLPTFPLRGKERSCS